MPWDRRLLLGYVETIQLVLGVTEKHLYMPSFLSIVLNLYIELLVFWWKISSANVL